jgi:outer membrane protein assembly factor BamB
MRKRRSIAAAMAATMTVAIAVSESAIASSASAPAAAGRSTPAGALGAGRTASGLRMLASAPLPWLTYHRDAKHSGVDPEHQSPLAPTRLWQTGRLDGQIYGEPLVYGSRVYVVTENDSVYALDVATGAVVWQRHVGIPVFTGGCGTIAPLGITSTPVIDPATKRIYAVAKTWDGLHTNSVHHILVGFRLADGAPVTGLPRTVDPPGSHPTSQLQRAALALDRGRVVIGYGGYAGDCGNYNGWLVAAPASGKGKILTFKVAPHGRGGSIWGGGSGPTVDRSGNIWVTTSNSFGPPFLLEGQDSVFKLSANLKPLDQWTPANWKQRDAKDWDLGSTEPLLLPGGLLFQIGKQGQGFLLSTAKLGGTGAAPVFGTHVCDAAAFGGSVYFAGVIYVPCFDGIHALALDLKAKSFAPLASWHLTAGAIGPPIVSAGRVWTAGWTNGVLYGLDPRTGDATFQTKLLPAAAVGKFAHFATPTATGGTLFVGAYNKVVAFRIAKSQHSY